MTVTGWKSLESAFNVLTEAKFLFYRGWTVIKRNNDTAIAILYKLVIS